MAEYEHGTMDVSAQEAAYDSFWAWCRRVAGFCVAVLALMYVSLT